MKTQNRPLEIVSKLREFSVEVSCLLTGRYRFVNQSITSHVVFEGDSCGETVAEFSHSLGHELPVVGLDLNGSFRSASLTLRSPARATGIPSCTRPEKREVRRHSSKICSPHLSQMPVSQTLRQRVVPSQAQGGEAY